MRFGYAKGDKAYEKGDKAWENGNAFHDRAELK